MTGQPLCPACNGGRLHPYKVEITLPDAYVGGWQGADNLVGWVAVCVGNKAVRRAASQWNEQHPDDEPIDVEDPIEPCGLTMPMQAYRWDMVTRRAVPAAT